MAESPVLLLSGHAPLSQAGRGAFQEMDQVAAARPVTKAAWLAQSTEHLGEEIRAALDLARSGRPGPVHVSLPSDLLGGHGELVERPEDLAPALARAAGAGVPACVNVVIDGVAAPTYRASAPAH
jgi:acetolactate synthase-1/2/3 large subunit